MRKDKKTAKRVSDAIYLLLERLDDLEKARSGG